MKKHLLALAATLLSTFVYAVGAEGDIRSIQAVPASDNWVLPKTVGETFCVRVRLLNENWGDALNPTEPKVHEWVIERNSIAIPSDAKDVLYRPALRLAVGSRKVNAMLAEIGPDGELNGVNPKNNFYTDLYFTYKVQEGDLGQPVRLVNAKDEIINSAADVGSTGFYLVNVKTANHEIGYWNLANDSSANLASFRFGPASPNPDPTDVRPVPDPERMEYDRIYPGVNVKTIDFQGADAEPWRDVYKGSDDAVGEAPAVMGFGNSSSEATAATTVYVWSQDESVVVPVGDTEEVVHPDGVTRHVLKVILPAKAAESEDIPSTIFKLKGADSATIGATTTIHLCSTKSPAVNGTGTMLKGSTLTRQVKVIEDTREPDIKILRAKDDRKTFTAEATADVAGTQMKIVLSKPYSKDLTVTLDYVKDENRFKVLQTGDATVDASIDEITIAKGETVAYFTLYPLGSTEDLKTTGVTIKPAVDAEAETFFSGGLIEAVAKITDQKPVVEVVGAPTSIVTGQEVEIDVKAIDNWSDLQPAIFTEGHKVQVQVDGQTVYTDTVHFTEDSAETVKFTVPTTILGDETTIQVRGQDGTHGTSWGDWTAYPVKVTSITATPTLFETDDPTATGVDKGIVFEGEALNIRAVLSRPSGETLYAYLRPANAATADLVVVSEKGAEINPDSAYPLVSDLIPLTLLDGDGLATPSTKVKLNLVLTKKPEWTGDEADLVKDYGCKDLAFAVANVQPTALSVTRDDTTIPNGGAITVASGTEIAFTVKVADQGALDMTDPDHPIEVKWWFPESENPQLDGQGDIVEEGTVGTDPDDAETFAKMTTEELVFSDENTTYKGYILLRDRNDANYGSDVWDVSSRVFSFTVKAGKEPTVQIEFPAGNASGIYYENSPSSENYFVVKMSEYPATGIGTLQKPLKVELTVKPYNTDDGKILIYDPEDPDSVPAETMTIEFSKKSQNTLGKQIAIQSDTQNGGSDKGGSRFKIYTRVLNQETRKDGIKWCDYYTRGDQPRGANYLRMVNIAPTLNLISGDNHSFGLNATNRWIAGEVVSLKWTVSDILRDLKSGNFTIEWDLLDADGKPAKTVTAADIVGDKPLGAVASGLYTFQVPDTPFMAVHVNANDGEGGLSEALEFFIQVAQTKKISVNTAGPSKQSATKYLDAEGLGQGHIYVDDSTGQYTARQFKQTWYYNESAKQAHVYAKGYRIDEVDDGKLGNDEDFIGAALNPNGNKWVSGDYYKNTSGYNSFFYCWATLSQEGEATLLTPEPSPNASVVADRRFLLDNEKPDEGTSYGTVEVEAIFSREFLSGDGVGDINADGIPDVVAKRFALGGSSRGTLPEDDFADISLENADNDALPETGRNLFTSTIPGAKESWLQGLNLFTAKMEIRGVHDGLNDALVKLGINGAEASAKRDYSDAEWRAWLAAGKAEDWSPENPTDPTLEDTDKDGFPDGYEYYYWYWAHVGKIDNNNHWSRLVGEKYNPLHPGKGIMMTPEEIEEIVNPTVPFKGDILDKDSVDSDGDGLPDLLELELGTNPFHWDTDGDGMPDGWEVRQSNTDPCKADAGANADGDYMAAILVTDMQVYGTVAADGSAKYYVGPMGLTEDGETVKVWFFGDGDKSYGLLLEDGEDETSFDTYFTKQSYQKGSEIFTHAYLKDAFPTSKLIRLMPHDNGKVTRGPGVQLPKGYEITVPAIVEFTEKVLSADLTSAAPFTERAYEAFRYGTVIEIVNNVHYSVYTVAKDIDGTVPAGTVIIEDPLPNRLYFMHHQVYQRRGFYFPEGDEALDMVGGGLVLTKDMGTGFNPLTAWMSDGKGKVGTRYHDPNKPEADPASYLVTKPGTAVDTRAFTAVDEFLVAYFHHACGMLVDDDLKPYSPKHSSWRQEQVWAAYTPNAGVPNAETPEAQGAAADSDGDGCPDGWELYISCGPGTNYSTDPILSNHFKNELRYGIRDNGPSDCAGSGGDENRDPITGKKTADMLPVQEFAATDTALAYPNTPSIQSKKNATWINKFFPTDPWSSDTDGDGLKDSEESAFIYGSDKFNDVRTDDGTSFCIPGGGLNPCSWDTDFDGLPDPWELQFKGVYITPETAAKDLSAIVRRDYERRIAAESYQAPKHALGCYLCGGMDGTVPDAYTNGDFNNQLLNVNRDYDYDGLDPWQEYLTGLIRVFRYDDVLSPWAAEKAPAIDEEIGRATFTEEQLNTYLRDGAPISPLYAIGGHADQIEMTGGSNPNLVFGKLDAWTAYGSFCRRSWDLVSGHWYYFPDGPNHCLRKFNNAYERRVTVDLYADVPGALNYLVSDDEVSEAMFIMDMTIAQVPVKQWEAPTEYATTDPRSADSDGDGMDDYYELFHGLNPLYGGSLGKDLIASAWNLNITATKNYWTEKNPTADKYDFVKFPWMAGDPAADPDGDDIRNIEEAIQANAQAPSTWLHTDPTPLWMTDSTSSNSFVRTSYGWVSAADQCDPVTNAVTTLGTPYAKFYLPEGAFEPLPMPGHTWNVISRFNYDFEMNEGFDSDHDGLTDYQETSSAAAGQTNPADSDDPHRRQAMYFPGRSVPSALQAQVDPHFMVNANSSLNFLTFTVECWVKPEQIKQLGGQVILERTVYTAGANPEDRKLLRRNFELGLDASGHYYAAFDHNGTGVARIVAAAGTEATKTWAHLAATYDGTSLNLYVNGKLMVNTPSTLHPATPAVTIKTSVGYEYYTSSETWDNDLNHSREKLVDDNAIIFGASAKNQDALNLGTASFASIGLTYDRFYKGYLDEVRIWDGARTPSEIEDNYARRFTQADLLANRKAVYDAFVEGATRSVNHEGVPELPPELAYHYNFSGLFAGAEPDEVAKVPFGFNAARAKAVRPAGWETEWWANLAVRSTVYDAKDFIPWIPNGVAHLPRFNGTTQDSVYWSDDYAAFTPASEMGFEKMTFPHTHELYPMRHEVDTVLKRQSTRTTILAGLNTDLTDNQKLIRSFTSHDTSIDGTELLPLGGAYVKYCEDYWDEQGPTTTWEVIGVDENNNGIGDWWEAVNSEYAGVSPRDPDKYQAALEAYRRDIASGSRPNNPYDTTFKQVADENRNGLPDWWEQLYSLTGTAGTDDFDNDGLSNYTEYLLSEVFDLKDKDGQHLTFHPRFAFSVDSSKPDYFHTIGSLYVGEIFTDHDNMNDAWERLWDESKVSAHSFDAYGDGDGDGWSNYAEFRCNTDPTRGEASSIVDNEGNCYTRVEYPVPMIHANVRYNGKTAPIGKVVFQAWNVATDKDMTGAPDAVWTVGSNEESGADGSSAHEKFVGRKPNGTHTINLTGGSIDEGSVKILFLDKGFNVVTVNTLTDRIVNIANGEPDKASWYYRIYDSDGKLVMIGNSLYGDTEETTVGTINYTTGEVTIDFDHEVMTGAMLGNRTEGDSAGENLKVYDYLDLNNSYVLVKWNSTKVRTSVAGDYYLADADLPTKESPSRGYIREGKNAFICFVDADEDGKYTPGELFGFVNDVDVGWSGATVNVLLTETHPVFARVKIDSAETDRNYWYGTESGNGTNVVQGTLPSPRKVHVRVVRTAINDQSLAPRKQFINGEWKTFNDFLELENTVVLDKEFNLEMRDYIHEGDFIGSGELDVDWNTFTDEVLFNQNLGDVDPTRVTYRIVLGEGSVSPTATNNLAGVTITRAYDSETLRKRAIPEDINKVETARPTLRWTMEGGAFNSYPVFQVKVYSAEDTLVYDSGERPTTELVIDANNAYTWQLPISVGDVVPGTGALFANNAKYTYTVAMLNSKFRFDVDEALARGKFMTNVPSANGACGVAAFTVKYFGPAETYANAPIRVQAFAKPDFKGLPIAATTVTDCRTVTGTAKNAWVIGIPAGRCFFLAYIDSNDNGVCDDWETKGWLSTRASATGPNFSPTPVTMEANIPFGGIIYLEDMDTDHDGIPDGYEFAVAGDLTTLGVVEIDDQSEKQKLAGITLYNGLSAELEKARSASLMSLAKTAGTVMNTLSNANVAALIMGLEPTADGSFKLPAPTVLENGVVIKSVTFEPASGKVMMTVATEAEGAVPAAASTIYETQTTATVKLAIEYSEDLSTWTKTEPITISVKAGTTEESVDTTVEALKGSKAGFFRVSIEQ